MNRKLTYATTLAFIGMATFGAVAMAPTASAHDCAGFIIVDCGLCTNGYHRHKVAGVIYCSSSIEDSFGTKDLATAAGLVPA